MWENFFLRILVQRKDIFIQQKILWSYASFVDGVVDLSHFSFATMKPNLHFCNLHSFIAASWERIRASHFDGIDVCLNNTTLAWPYPIQDVVECVPSYFKMLAMKGTNKKQFSYLLAWMQQVLRPICKKYVPTPSCDPCMGLNIYIYIMIK